MLDGRRACAVELFFEDDAAFVQSSPSISSISDWLPSSSSSSASSSRFRFPRFLCGSGEGRERVSSRSRIDLLRRDYVELCHGDERTVNEPRSIIRHHRCLKRRVPYDVVTIGLRSTLGTLLLRV